MPRGYRLLLSCLLALLLPLQGVAATAMLLCGPAHHAPTAAAATASHHESAHNAGPATHEHHAAGKPAVGKCSVCAACCMGTAIVAEMIVLAAVAAPSVYTLRPFAAPVAVTANGLDRPPKGVLA